MSVETDHRIYLAPASNDLAQEHLHRTVVDGLDPDEYPQLEHTDGDRIHLWGTTETIADRYDIERGDVLLFYTGDRIYSLAAFVERVTHDPESADEIWSQGDSTWSQLLYLSVPRSVEITGTQIKDYADYSIEYILGFQSLNDQGHRAIIAAYDSVPNFLEAHAREGGMVTPPGPAAESDGDTDTFAPQTSTEVESVGLGSGITPQTLIETLEQRGSAILWGPPGAGTPEAVEAFALDWLGRDDRVHITTVRPEDGYADFVERVHPAGTHEGYDTTDGPFKRVSRLADAAYVQAGDDADRFVLVVDGIDAVGPSSLFGATLHAIARPRPERLTISLPHSHTPFGIPPNLLLVGLTRSTPPRDSIPASLADRFPVLRCGVDYDFLESTYESYASSDRTDLEPTVSIDALRVLNERLTDTAGTHAQIGHEYLLDRSRPSLCHPRLLSVWEFDILPTADSLVDGSTTLTDRIDRVFAATSRADRERATAELVRELAADN